MLTQLLREHPDEVESDYHRFYGRSVYSFQPLVAAQLLAGILANTDTATYRAVFPDWQWHLVSNHLAAWQVDILSLLWWSKTRDGQKNINRPMPLPRPGLRGDDPEKAFTEMDIDALEAALALPRVPIDKPL